MNEASGEKKRGGGLSSFHRGNQPLEKGKKTVAGEGGKKGGGGRTTLWGDCEAASPVIRGKGGDAIPGEGKGEGKLCFLWAPCFCPAVL